MGLNFRERRALAHEFDRVGVTETMEVNTPPDSGSAGEAIHHVAAISRIEGASAKRAEQGHSAANAGIRRRVHLLGHHTQRGENAQLA